jgi:cytoplasmic FMR1 interacting protein
MNRKTFDVLAPQIAKMKAIAESLTNATDTFVAVLSGRVAAEQKRAVQPQALLDELLRVFHTFLLVDSVKDMKVSLTNDFSRYKRSFASIRGDLENADEIGAGVHELQMFLSNPAQAHNLLMHNVRTEVHKKISGYEDVVIALIIHAVEAVESKRFLLPDDTNMLHRVVPVGSVWFQSPVTNVTSFRVAVWRISPQKVTSLRPLICANLFSLLQQHLLYLLDSPSPDLEEKGRCNAFAHKKLKLGRLQKIYRYQPVIPLYGDMHTNVLHILARCQSYDADRMDSSWASTTTSKLHQSYLLVHHIGRIRREYATVTCDYAAMLNEVRAHNRSKIRSDSLAGVPDPPVLDTMFATVMSVLRTCADWTSRVWMQTAFKYAHPISDAQYAAKSGSTEPASMQNVYDKVVRYNYSPEELYVLIDVIGMIKGLGDLMLSTEAEVLPMIRRCIHRDVQAFLQRDVAEPLQRAHAGKKKVAAMLLAMRDVAADWSAADAGRREAYQDKKSQDHKRPWQFPARHTSPSRTQQVLIRRMASTIFDVRSDGMQAGMFTVGQVVLTTCSSHCFRVALCTHKPYNSICISFPLSFYS